MPFPHYWKSVGWTSLMLSGRQNARGYYPKVENKRWLKTSWPSSISKWVAKALGFQGCFLFTWNHPRGDHRTNTSCAHLIWGTIKSPSVSAQLLRSLKEYLDSDRFQFVSVLHKCSSLVGEAGFIIMENTVISRKSGKDIPRHNKTRLRFLGCSWRVAGGVFLKAESFPSETYSQGYMT